MRKHKLTRLSKYITLLVSLCFLFTFSFTTSARYSEKGSSDKAKVDVSSFDVTCQLFDENNKEVTDLSVETASLSSYSVTYYLLIVNDSNFDITYSVSIEDPFYFSGDTKTNGVISTFDSERIKLNIYLDSDKLIEGTTSYDIAIGVDVVQGSMVIEEEIPEDAIILTDGDINSTLSSGYYYLASDISASGYIVISGDTTINLNGYNLTLDNYGGYAITVNSNASLTLLGVGTITNSSGGGIYINRGATLSMSMESVEYCNGYGVYVSNGSTFNLSGAPVIRGNESGNVYLESEALITLSGSIVSGAYIGVTKEGNTGQITPEEENTTHYVNARNYIHSDDPGYKVVKSSAHHGLVLMEASTINFTVALENTATSGSSTRDFYIAGAAASYEGAWDHDYDNYYAYSMHSYLGYEYDYQYYYDFGNVSLNDGFNFCVSGYIWYDNLFTNGIARSESLNFDYSDSNFYLWGTQYYKGADSGDDWSTNSEWGFDFSELSSDSTLYSTNEFTIVLMLDFREVQGDWDTYDNLVTDFYFLLDGDRVNRS